MGKRVWFESGDINPLPYGGKWIRYVGGRRYHVVELTNMDEACGSANEGRTTYVVELSEVDLDTADLKAAREYCGSNQEETDLVLAEMVHSYGQKAPLGSWESNNGWKDVRAAKAESRALEDDPDAYEAKMEAPVNRIGSTAREYQAGDTNSAILRGLAKGDLNAEIMAKLMLAASK